MLAHWLQPINIGVFLTEDNYCKKYETVTNKIPTTLSISIRYIVIALPYIP